MTTLGIGVGTRRAVVVAVLAGSLLNLTGCGIRALKRSEVTPRGLASAPRVDATLKAHLHDGSVIVFDAWTWSEPERAVHGTGRRLDPDRRGGEVRTHVVSVDSVALFESNELVMPGAMVAITLMTSIHALGTLLCLTNPKACFGSCPTFYASDGEKQALMAEGFSASIAPSLEATDLDALDRAVLGPGPFELTVTNEAYETHVLRRADLVLVPRPPGTRAVADPERRLWHTRDWRPPVQATGSEGDCRTTLASRDGVERTSLADSSDLAARETLELRFADAPARARGLVLVARQSLLSTYVFYQALAWMGRSAGTWLASLGSADANRRALTFGPARVLGGIEVQVRDGRDWVTVGEFQETGPLASDTRLLRLPDGPAGPLDVRLRCTRGLWRLDHAALVSVQEPADPVRLAPALVLRRGKPDAAALAALRDRTSPLVTLPGDTLVLVYDLPAGAGESDLLLESRGYYLEWMRDTWLAEEDPARLAKLFLDPRTALREMAPAFKRVEPEMEALFWGSRYAR